VGDEAPTFTLPDADGNPVSLSDFAGRPVIVYFYPAAMTPGCTTEACDFTTARGSFDSGGYTVLGISPDRPEKLATFRDKENLSIVLLSDADRSVMTAYGAFGEKKMYGKTVQGVIRSTFVVGADGRIEQAWRNVKATGHVARVLTELGLAS
jgi:peroxiredoxin Q/BCP